jgi:hypothetical protein
MRLIQLRRKSTGRPHCFRGGKCCRGGEVSGSHFPALNHDDCI